MQNPSSRAGEGDRFERNEERRGERSGASSKQSSAPRHALRATPLPSGESGRRVCVAQVGAAHGLNGEVRLKSFTEEPEAVARYGALQTEDGTRQVEIAALRAGKDGLIVKFAGVNDRTAAEALCNVRLYVPRVRLPETEDDTFYHADLIGLAVTTVGGETIGAVIAVHNFGAGDILEIALAGRGDSVMLPFTDSVVPVVDIAAGSIVVDPPEGVLEPSVSSRPRAAKRRASRNP